MSAPASSTAENPEAYNLPSDYTFARNSWGDSFYKVYGQMKFLDAEAQCVSDGALLALPRSDCENDFIAGLIPDQPIWIGLTDINEEGKFVTSDGVEPSYTKWDTNNNQPNNVPHPGGYDEDATFIIGMHSWLTKGFWGDDTINSYYNVVCSYSIPQSK